MGWYRRNDQSHKLMQQISTKKRYKIRHDWVGEEGNPAGIMQEIEI